MDHNTLYISKEDETYLKILADKSIKQELSDFFSFDVKNYHFMPKQKKRFWDGKIRLYSRDKLYIGLLPYVGKFCKERDYKIHIEDSSIYKKNNITLKELKEFIETLNLPTNIQKSKFEIRSYQLEYILHAINSNRCVLFSPTSSGKSLIIYILLKWYNKKALVISDTTNLVEQMKSDFIEYGCNPNDIHTVMAGKEKTAKDKSIVISTWQSLYKLPEEYFAQYDVIIADECHKYKATCLKSIMEKSKTVKYRFGLTGSIDDEEIETNRLVLEGLFGQVKQFITTKELIDMGYVSDLKINCVTFNYSDEDKKKAARLNWQDELMFLCQHEKRNNHIKNMTLSCKKNVLVLYNYIEKHGDILYDLISKSTDREVYYIHGGTKTDQREKIRKIAESSEDAIIIASYGTFSTGISIRNLHYLIFASPFKSLIRNLQSIGRVLRKNINKKYATLFDISDDLRINKDKPNYSLSWFIKRIQRYNNEGFSYNLHTVQIK